MPATGGRGNGVRVVALALATLPVLAAGPTAARAAGAVTITIESNRADLISGGDALVAISLPAGADPATVRVRLGGGDVTSAFASRPDGRFEGLVTGLANGVNTLTATLTDGSGASIRITNHPSGGPVFSGPQIRPWTCLAGARDAQCDVAPTYTYQYMPIGQAGLQTCPFSPGLVCVNGFQGYDPGNPPSDVATTTTDQGVTVPYIVRVETGAVDRGQYQVATLFTPGQPWQPWAPQKQWNHKLEITGGASCGFQHGEGTAPFVLDDTALSRGFAVASTSLDNNGQDCNVVIQSESLVMMKEHFIEAYGPMRYTIGSGCSGGSIYQQQDGNEYPGIFNGIQPMCSYPDDWTTTMEPEDCSLLMNYWSSASASLGWNATNEARVEGHQSIAPCEAWANNTGAYGGYNQGLNPSQTGAPNSCGVGTGANNPDTVYDAHTNPAGVRCTLQDYGVAQFGRRPPSVWTAPEMAIGRGFANRAYDNIGVQYGLAALTAGQISPAQFADLNANIGSHDIDYTFQKSRTAADPAGLATAYRGGMVDEANGLASMPIIDMRGHDTEEIHEDFRSYAQRARLDNANGNHNNQVIWTGPYPIVTDPSFQTQAFVLMDQWLANIEKDTSTLALQQKVIADKPVGAADTCFDGSGQPIPLQSTCSSLYPVFSDPRMVGGEPQNDDVLKCRLKPLGRSDYLPATFTDSDWALLQQAFPAGVCDYSRTGVFQQRNTTWMTYANGPGGVPLGDPPVSIPFRPTATAANPNTAPAAAATTPASPAALVALSGLLLVLGSRRGRGRRWR